MDIAARGPLRIGLGRHGFITIFADFTPANCRKRQKVERNIMGRKILIASPSEVLGGIQWYIAKKGMPPTVAELRDYFGVGSTRTITRYLKVLEEMKWIRRWPGARGIAILNLKPIASTAASDRSAAITRARMGRKRERDL